MTLEYVIDDRDEESVDLLTIYDNNISNGDLLSLPLKSILIASPGYKSSDIEIGSRLNTDILQ